uniref:Uncharacterized protein n=1 Tax=Peronospora matthiolae TaxID=2874970 RepID=A0AAV1U2Y4_9STRA
MKWEQPGQMERGLESKIGHPIQVDDERSISSGTKQDKSDHSSWRPNRSGPHFPIQSQKLRTKAEKNGGLNEGSGGADLGSFLEGVEGFNANSREAERVMEEFMDRNPG